MFLDLVLETDLFKDTDLFPGATIYLRFKEMKKNVDFRLSSNNLCSEVMH